MPDMPRASVHVAPRRFLQNVSLKIKVGGAVCLAIVTSLVVVGLSFVGNIAAVSRRMLDDFGRISQASTNTDLSVARAFFDDLGADVRRDVLAWSTSTDLGFLVAANRAELPATMGEWLGTRVERFSFLALIDDSGRALARLRVRHPPAGASAEVSARVEPLPPTADRFPSSPVLERAWSDGALAGIVVLDPPTLAALGLADAARVRRAADGTHEDRGLALAAFARTRVEGKAYLLMGGLLLNNDVSFVDRVRSILYPEVPAGSAPEAAHGRGSVTVFLEGMRVSTNVRTHDGNRAVGTRVSDEVARRVLTEGRPWLSEAMVLTTPHVTAYTPLRDVFERIVGILYVGVPTSNFLATERRVTESLTGGARRSLAMALAVGLLAALVLGVLMVRLLTAPLVALRDCTTAVAGGDLRHEPSVGGSDEVGSLADGFRRMVVNLRELTAQLHGAVADLGTATDLLGTTLRDNAATTSQQSAAVTQTTATLEELAASSRQIADSCMQVVAMATKTLESARGGVDLAEATLQRMGQIRTADERDIERLRDLSRRLRRVDEIMVLIDTISDQTKLIAFNAAIEAAAAGDAGRRFGVVSAEIRRLADGVLEQGREIRHQVADLQQAASELVSSREDAGGRVADGESATSAVSDKLREILDDSESVLINTRQISLATQQQRSATEQTLGALREIQSGVTQLAAAARGTEAAMGTLDGLAGTLQRTAGRFVTNEPAPPVTAAEPVGVDDSAEPVEK